VIYAAVSVIGLVDGKDVLGLFPIDKADNVLHILLAVAAIAVGLLSARDPEPAREPGVSGLSPGAEQARART
jgi:Domain of unknown function (DUF4383)